MRTLKTITKPEELGLEVDVLDIEYVLDNLTRSNFDATDILLNVLNHLRDVMEIED